MCVCGYVAFEQLTARLSGVVENILLHIKFINVGVKMSVVQNEIIFEYFMRILSLQW